MSRATILQAAVTVILAGLFLMLAGSAPAPAPPTPVRSWRPATPEEERHRAEDRLYEELLRQQRQHQTPST
ncbi:hypothetical protein [Micromonospora coerulea]|uniref:hypothetical protein n=1 Tax=Micromonospora coerulea TaxID=47856 RepID=UPI001906B7CB|nr:hypothetical protein [Micromonospora veneta]